MAEVDSVTFVLILFVISLVFLSGLFWCFCCGTCVGRSLLGQTPFRHWVRDNRGHQPWEQDEEEFWPLDRLQDYDDNGDHDY
ncbi:hypothetical protein BC941DRAFT_477104 [Chlamydoabsidia padenii]|nr:hypothetical protein BC941DRAFT_477104 [Chlamydoabsidia padenii]